MAKHRFRRFDSCCEKERRPIHGVKTKNVFTDKMHIDRPILREFRIIGFEADTTEITIQRVEPYIEDMVRIVRKRNSPFQCGAADRYIF